MKNILLASAVVLIVLALFTIPAKNLGSAPDGIPATVSIATTTQVGPQEKIRLFASNGACTARTIRTQGEGIFLTFADPTNGDLASTTLGTTAGFLQTASTTVLYDSGTYGCGKVYGYAEASTTITVMETR